MRAEAMRFALARAWCCLVLLELVARCEDVVKEDTSVLLLDASNFNAAMREHPRILVQFFAPWCGHCKNLEPEYEQAAKLLAGNVAFAKVDATMEVDLANQFGVGGYPSVFLIQKGNFNEFTGRRTAAGIVEWVREKAGPALIILEKEDELKPALTDRGAADAFVARGSAALQNLMGRVAEKHRALGSYFFLKDERGQDEVIIHRGLDEMTVMAVNDAGRPEAEQDVLVFLHENLLPHFGEIAEENFYHYESSGAQGLLWALFANGSGTGHCLGHDCRNVARQHADVFRALAYAVDGIKVVFVDIETYKDYVHGELGVDKFPAVMFQKGILSATEGTEVFRYTLHLNETIAVEPIYAWLEDIFNGRVKDDDLLADETLEPFDAGESSYLDKSSFQEL